MSAGVTAAYKATELRYITMNVKEQCWNRYQARPLLVTEGLADIQNPGKMI